MTENHTPKARLPLPPQRAGQAPAERLVDALGRDLRVGAWVRLLGGQRDRRGVVTATNLERQEVHVLVDVEGQENDLLLAPDDVVVLSVSGHVADASGQPLSAGAYVLDQLTDELLYVNAIVSGGRRTATEKSVYVSNTRGLFMGLRQPRDLIVQSPA